MFTIDADQIQRITGYKRPGDQLRELHSLGFWRARRCRVTGQVILEQPHYDAVCRGQDAKPASADRPRPRVIKPQLSPA